MTTGKNIKSTIWLLAFTFLTSAALSTAAYARQDIVKESFSVSEGGTLYIDVDIGNVEILTASGSEVTIVMERDLRNSSNRELKETLARHEYFFDREGDDVIVETRFDRDDESRAWRRWKKSHNLRVSFFIRVPDSYNVEFRSGAGNIEIADLSGSIEGRTGAGNVDIGDIQGPVDISSGAGNISIASAYGEIYVHSGAGDITLDGIEGEIEARTGAGNIYATITNELSGDSSFGTGAGDITVYVDDSVGADVTAHSSMGSARTDYDLRVRGKWMSKSFSGEINGGGPEISLSAGVGNVSLRRN